jgi:hypothetical protein
MAATDIAPQAVDDRPRLIGTGPNLQSRADCARVVVVIKCFELHIIPDRNRALHQFAMTWISDSIFQDMVQITPSLGRLK